MNTQQKCQVIHTSFDYLVVSLLLIILLQSNQIHQNYTHAYIISVNFAVFPSFVNLIFLSHKKTIENSKET